MVFSETLVSIRKKAGLSQEKLAEQLHVTRQAVSKWEAGQSTPDLEMFSALCDALDTTPNELLGVEMAEPTKTTAPPQQKKVDGITGVDLYIVALLVCGVAMLLLNLFNHEGYEPNVSNIAFMMMFSSVIWRIVASLRGRRKERR